MEALHGFALAEEFAQSRIKESTFMPKTKLKLREIQPEDLFAFKTIPDAQISPDGKRVAHVVSEIDAEKDDYRTSIWVVSADGGEPAQFTRGKKRDSAPRWSPDGTMLAFLSDR